MQSQPSKKTNQTNNFDCIRISAALLVLISHHYALTGRSEPSFFGLHSWGGVAVLIFFSISGYLVSQSWFNDPNVFRFTVKRVLRIWPALAATIILTTIIIGPITTSLSIKDYLTNPGTFQYLKNIFLKIYYNLPGVFEKNPYAYSVNGSIWTIPLEVKCYLILATIGALSNRIGRAKILFLSVIAIYLFWYITKGGIDITKKMSYPRELLAFFLSGSLIFISKEHWKKRPILWLFINITISTIFLFFERKYSALLTSLPFFTIYLGTLSTPVIRNFGRWGDPSYGIYLIAFPIQQTIISFYLTDLYFLGTLIISITTTVIIAYISWHSLEKQAIKLKPRK